MKQYKNIIFDLGGVILDIDYDRMAESFRDLGLKDFSTLYTLLRQERLFDDFEMGLISAADFRNRLRTYATRPVTDREIDDAWNSILIGLPKENVDMLFDLHENHRLFLLSNTNEIHEKEFRAMIERRYGEYIFDRIFEKMYLSHHLHLRKPDEAVFQKVISAHDLVPEETVFIDDSPRNIEGAKRAGLETVLLEKGKTIRDLWPRG